ncbi:MAG: helix-turn-helix domain-containing protein [Proteobacteria bacterium]|nr:helix-turn-helix domain-containing protein [Pseudomonadota bacterium]
MLHDGSFRSRDDDTAEAGPAPGPGVGTLLRAARLRCGQEIDDVSVVLRIRPANLEAIEEGRFEDLPGPTYAVGFVRAYADHLGLDADEVIRRFRADVESVNRRTELTFPAPMPDSGVPRGALLLIALLFAGAVYGGWYYLSSAGLRLTDLVPPVPERLLADRAEPASPRAASDPSVAVAAEGGADRAVPAAAEPAGAVGGPAGRQAPAAAGEAGDPQPAATRVVLASPSSAAEAPPARAVPAAGSAPASSERDVLAALPVERPESRADGAERAALPAIPPVPAAGEATPGNRVFGTTGASRIVLRATSDSWVQVRDAGNLPLVTRMLRAGDSYRVPAQKGLVLITGNAGALDILVDGEVVPPIGPAGGVRRDVALDPELLKKGLASRP